MRYVSVVGLDRPCSQIVLGTVVFSPENIDVSCEVLDAFVSRGGNTIDTAHVYGRGKSEQAVGMWLNRRNNRKDITIITKGAHHHQVGVPRVNPDAIAQDLNESLERLQTDYIDIYMLHRDDPNVPVGVIMDALNEHKSSGKIRHIGVSNWSYQRIEEANAYAAEKGIAGISVNSPNLSLAKPKEPRWAGCVSVDSDYLGWHEQSEMPLFSWSSQAGGFFTGRFSPENTEDTEMVRTYYSDENWERLRRARQLAEQKGTNANQIALAYVLNQPFPTCALIGPQNTDELYSSLQALEIELTPEEIQWLDLKA